MMRCPLAKCEATTVFFRLVITSARGRHGPAWASQVLACAWPALELRDTVLTAPSAAERLAIAKTGLVDSIYKLKGGQWPMNSYYW